MRPIRLLISLSFCILTITTLLFLLPAQRDHLDLSAQPSTKKKGKLRALFSFQTPLFPPSAIISLTDDNSTFFLARPAAFGPLLPANGLSGQLWIGSGFGEDNLGRGGRAEGELGCSDVPGWDASLNKPGHIANGDPKMKYTSHTAKQDLTRKVNGKPKRADAKEDRLVDAEESNVVASDMFKTDDGTDDHLLKDSDARKAVSKHADIQSLQESAEIAGKVVLLSRGGCGFLEKVKWVQRRGGKAVIVGDDVRGGQLVTMYARGDTTNVTVPAIFTSYTTAHLLSSLIPYGGAFGAISMDGNKIGTFPAKLNKGKGKNPESDDNKPRFTTTAEASKPTAIVKENTENVLSNAKSASPIESHKGLIRSILSWVGLGGNQNPSAVSRRPPNSGGLDWVMVEEWDDDRPKKTKKKGAKPKDTSANPTADNFVIGVHDWRDPGLLSNKKTQDSSAVNLREANKAKDNAKAAPTRGLKLKGGSITPGSGEYENPATQIESNSEKKTATHGQMGKEKSGPLGDGWLSHLHWGHDNAEHEHHEVQCAGKKCTILGPSSSSLGKSSEQNKAKNRPDHEGLWVTLTPTNMSSSPFFDTLLVLVVSPLATLTVVYALLLLRSRIRRRRWRAPKSVVERLPVRTYHTISSEASTTSIATPISSSPSTPLLSPGPRRIISRSSSRSRPRSRTTSEVPGTATSSSPFSEHHESISAQEKRENGLAEWRRRYGGRQKECVVCLEEYVDGVSRVMSLPCGHEFHAECITPWLTTRRRTCPICKGDVVRSMQRGSLSRQNSYDRHQRDASSSDEDEDEVQAQAANNRNDSPTSAMPMPFSNNPDLELGIEEERRSRSSSPRPLPLVPERWRDWLMGFLGGRGAEPEVDRNR
ncbi:hypothetical protein E6O75_ATG11461 [Venturia nashicola]|uniref:RING-type E3 ubiquitin transferase n=1 Tax=Venturia nashicola TaxID=86259 RepID=A0A4Z1P3N2_9PEZI|nr:hypothetical protein E6O75_ATG11461 [Venturia nashicola]